MIALVLLRSRLWLLGVTAAAAQYAVDYPRRVTALVFTLLLAAGTGAWALATLAAADPALSAVVNSQTLAPQAASSSKESSKESFGPLLNLYRSDTTRSTDTPDILLKRLGVDDLQAAQFLRTDALAQQNLFGRSGRSVRAETTGQQQLAELSVRWALADGQNFQRLLIQRSGAGFVSKLEQAPLSVSTRMASGVIHSSLFAAAALADVPDAVTSQVAELFSADIDFRRALREKDRFSVVYEVLEGDGEQLRSGRLLSAEFVNAGKVFQAVWFQPPGPDQNGRRQPGAYYSLDGRSLQRVFLSAPLTFSRVTSGFAMRFHPILKKWIKHEGTDLAAPNGTPVRSVADGVVSFAGMQRGYGNVIFIKHRNRTETVYAHLSKIMVKPGQHLEQGATIGLVGSTGWATGPHLHYEVRVNGVQKDPMLMAKMSQTVPLADAFWPAFKQVAEQARVQLLAAAKVEPSNFE